VPLQQTGLMEPRLPQPSFPQLDHLPLAPPRSTERGAATRPVPGPRPPACDASAARLPPAHAPRPPSAQRASSAPDRAAGCAASSSVRAAMPSAEEILDVEELSVEDLVTFSEVTLTIPLYRPDTQPERPAAPPRRGMIGQGKRLR
jgi:hypothetical protein